MKQYPHYYENNRQTYLLMNYFSPIKKHQISSKCVHSLNSRTLGTFLVKAQPEEDIYHIFSTTKERTFVGIALIPTYTTSVMMNSLFRHIKENNDLDALEESDDEEEFETDDNLKHVFLDRVIKMECEYNGKFKKWIPLHVIDK
jgi:hypothetical protein